MILSDSVGREGENAGHDKTERMKNKAQILYGKSIHFCAI